MQVVFEGNPILHNPYGIIAINSRRYPDIYRVGAQALIDWMISPEGQAMIGDFRIQGERLFIPPANTVE